MPKVQHMTVADEGLQGTALLSSCRSCKASLLLALGTTPLLRRNHVPHPPASASVGGSPPCLPDAGR